MSTDIERIQAAQADRWYRLGKDITEAQEFPPNPVNAQSLAKEVGAPTGVEHRHWSQPAPPVELLKQEVARIWRDTPNHSPEERHLQETSAIARQVARVPNPLRSLAAALSELADDLDARMVIPVGVTLMSHHEVASEDLAPSTRHHRRAEVAISVATIGADWVREAATRGALTEEVGEDHDRR
jgi:hypothetical protein